MSLMLQQESALNLTLEGSVGSFRVGGGLRGQNSLEVKYFLTYVGLNFSSGSNNALLSELAPVREIFDFNSLDFDEIMQRDIDDSRVSNELIPYLLDEKSIDLIKLFPPIIVVVLPIVDDRNKPASLYPHIETYKDIKEKQNYLFTRSGQVGREVFQIEQPILEGNALTHDLVRFKLNTHRSRLVIVDGQHRAMALLAIYRNLKDQWSDEKRAPYKEYYSEWTINYINQFNLAEINLPLMLCTFPDLDYNYIGDFDIKKAARSIFLTLNKTARKVSNSRNILLDDNDLISFFLRRTLSEVKRKDPRSQYSFRIWNVELDQSGDKMKIQSQIAITGVNHIYYIIEHAMLNNEDIRGISPRSGRFGRRNYLDDCLERLDGRNCLGIEVSNSIKRDSFSIDAAEKLGDQFDKCYGNFIISFYEMFAPYEKHNRSTLNLETRLEVDQDRRLLPIFFEGQGIGRVFESHRSSLREKLKEDYFRTDVPKIEAVANRLDATARRISEYIEEFRAERASLCLQDVYDKNKLRINGKNFHPTVVNFFNKIFDEIFFTVAFQSALICGFFDEIEKFNRNISKNNTNIFEEYVEQLNNFFIPKSTTNVKKLISVFEGEVDGDNIEEWKIIPSKQTFRNVVYRGEMQPAQWPKYKYLILEIWKPSDSNLLESINKERKRCRKQVFSALYNTYKVSYCQERLKHEEDLEKHEINTIFESAFSSYSGLIKNLSWMPLDREKMFEEVMAITPSEDSLSDEDAEWDDC